MTLDQPGTPDTPPPGSAPAATSALGSPEPSDQYVQSLVRGLSVITAFDADHPRMTLSDIAAATSLTRATARRFLLTLVEVGYVQTDGRLFSLTPRVLDLGYSYLSALGLPEIAQPFLEELSHATSESSSASILDGADIVYVARVAVRRIMSVSISVGTRFPAHSTSMGRVLLAALAPDALAGHLDHVHLAPLTPRTIADRAGLEAELARVRRDGYALVDQELELGLRSIAVPIVSAGATVAAVNVSVSTGTYSLEQMRDTLLPPLRRAAAAIGHGLDLTPASRRG